MEQKLNMFVCTGLLGTCHFNVKFIGMHVTDIRFYVHFVRPVSLGNHS